MKQNKTKTKGPIQPGPETEGPAVEEPAVPRVWVGLREDERP